MDKLFAVGGAAVILVLFLIFLILTVSLLYKRFLQGKYPHKGETSVNSSKSNRESRSTWVYRNGSQKLNVPYRVPYVVNLNSTLAFNPDLESQECKSQCGDNPPNYDSLYKTTEK